MTAVAEVVIALLLVASGVLVLVSAVGFARLQDFFLRMHPPALAYTLANCCVAVAGVIAFSMQEQHLVLFPLIIPLVTAVTVPVTTVLLARVALFRRREAGGDDVPVPLSPPPTAP